MGPRERQPFSASLTAFAGVKESFFEAAILIVAPVEGLRPSRAGVSFTLNLPKPGMLVSAPERAASEISWNTLDDRLGLRLGQTLLGGDLVGDFGCCRHSVHPFSVGGGRT